MSDGNTSYQVKYTDSFPNIPRAGKLRPVGYGTKTCLQEVPAPPTPPVVRKFRNSTQPEPGAIRVHQGKANDPDVAGTLVHGVSTKSSLAVSKLTGSMTGVTAVETAGSGTSRLISTTAAILAKLSAGWGSHRSVGGVMNSTEPGRYTRGRDQQRSLVNAVRHRLKKVNFQNFSSLLQAFRHYDKKGKGMIDKEDLQEVCREFHLDVSGPVLDDLIDYCDTDKDGLINFLEFANFLNWKDKMPINSSRTFGIPSVRSDLPAPRIKRVSDPNNYGDTSTAADLLHPSVHTLRGVHEQHFFCPRTKTEIAEIFRNVDVNISEETFEEAWKLASMRHPTGEVCVEVFRNILKEIKAVL
eukprot:superscaffoldBa00001452_g10617